jgi:outer membrane receptor protein involved in Fe transport
MSQEIRVWGAAMAAIGMLTLASAARAQDRGSIAGTITDARGGALVGAGVLVEGVRLSASTDRYGKYHVTAVPPGVHAVVIRLIGYDAVRRIVTVVAGETVALDAQLVETEVQLDAVVVSATGETERIAATPAGIGTVRRDEIKNVRPAHPSEIMNRMAGVWVNVTGGEGHTMAIRQPMTTDPVYLYLEDGIPSRSTGFFNHNALYEINLPQAEGVEVLKGPGSALYGSDAIGGVVNVSTRPPARRPELALSAEGGAWGFGRVLGSASNTFGDNGLRLDANYTRTDGWRDGTSYDRQSATARWDRYFAGGRLKSVIAWSNIDQNTAGSSAILLKDYENVPTFNYTPISFRKVRALRISSAYERQGARSLISITPFARMNSMEMIPNWTLTFDPQRSKTENASLGLLARYRHDFGVLDARLIVGVDVDHSPGDRLERIIGTTSYQRTVDSSATSVTRARVFTAFRDSTTVYDYDVTFHGVSPYMHFELAPLPRLRLSVGARFDALGYNYTNHLSDTAAGRWRRPGDTTLSYSRVSPKVGALYAFGPGATVFAAFRSGFRAPSEGQIFRQGSTVSTVDLKPVKVESYELGVRGRMGQRVSFDVVAYTMQKFDDILSFTSGTGAGQTVTTSNAGETRHRGVEVGLGFQAAPALVFSANYTYGKHTYMSWQPSPTANFSGNEMDIAPRHFGSAQVRYSPALLGGGELSAEISRMGWYWMAPANTDPTGSAHIYDGHTLVNLRASWVLAGHTTVFARLLNATNQRYAERATYNVARGEEFSPGLPRTFYLGVQYQ